MCLCSSLQAVCAVDGVGTGLASSICKLLCHLMTAPCHKPSMGVPLPVSAGPSCKYCSRQQSWKVCRFTACPAVQGTHVLSAVILPVKTCQARRHMTTAVPSCMRLLACRKVLIERPYHSCLSSSLLVYLREPAVS